MRFVVVAVILASLIAACGTGERVYYTPPTRSPAASGGGQAGTPARNATQSATATPDTHMGATPYPTPGEMQAAASRRVAIEVCPEAKLEECVSAFVIVDASPWTGLLCVEPDGDFHFQMDRRYQPFPHPGARTLPISSPDEGIGVPCRSNLTAMSVALVGGHAQPP